MSDEKKPVVGRPFVTGDPRINRGGRPKGIAKLIREMTGEDGLKLATLAWDLANGNVFEEEITSEGERKRRRVPVSGKTRGDMVRYLTDRGHGKTPQTVVVLSESASWRDVMPALSDEELDALERIADKAAAIEPTEPGGSEGGESPAPAGIVGVLR